MGFTIQSRCSRQQVGKCIGCQIHCTQRIRSSCRCLDSNIVYLYYKVKNMYQTSGPSSVAFFFLHMDQPGGPGRPIGKAWRLRLALLLSPRTGIQRVTACEHEELEDN